MSSAVNQLYIEYLPAHDRMVMRVAASNQELRLWLTRRFVRKLWAVLLEALQGSTGFSAEDDQTREEVLSFQHQQAVDETQFTKNYQPNPGAKPVTQQPILLVNVRSVEAEKQTRLEFTTVGNKTFQLGLDVKTMHSVCKLLADCAHKAEWDLDLELAKRSEAASEVSRTLN